MGDQPSKPGEGLLDGVVIEGVGMALCLSLFVMFSKFVEGSHSEAAVLLQASAISHSYVFGKPIITDKLFQQIVLIVYEKSLVITFKKILSLRFRFEHFYYKVVCK